MKLSRHWCAALLALASAGCATTRVVLLPGADGKVGKIALLKEGGGETVLDTAYSEATVSGSGSIGRNTLEASSARAAFNDAAVALPPRPISYTLYFVRDSDELTPESDAQAKVILAEIARRPAAEVVVIGHADRIGSDEYNDQLSLERARAVRQQLVTLGFDARQVSVAGRGAREPAVLTRSEVEPRNRRAEITVR